MNNLWLLIKKVKAKQGVIDILAEVTDEEFMSSKPKGRQRK